MLKIKLKKLIFFWLAGASKEGGAGAVDEDDFIKAFTDVPSVQVRILVKWHSLWIMVTSVHKIIFVPFEKFFFSLNDYVSKILGFLLPSCYLLAQLDFQMIFFRLKWNPWWIMTLQCSTTCTFLKLFLIHCSSLICFILFWFYLLPFCPLYLCLLYRHTFLYLPVEYWNFLGVSCGSSPLHFITESLPSDPWLQLLPLHR